MVEAVEVEEEDLPVDLERTKLPSIYPVVILIEF